MLERQYKLEKMKAESHKIVLLTQLHESAKQIDRSSNIMKQIISSSAKEFRFQLASRPRSVFLNYDQVD